MKHDNGSWKEPFDPRLVGTWYQDNFYEAGTWTYSLYVPQDDRGLIAQIGGKDLFKKRLDLFFEPVFDPNSTHSRHRYDVGNEPGFLSPYLYNWIGEQSSTAKTIRTILPESYHTGLAGNDDSGAMGSFLVFNQLGFFPVAAQTST
jgi:putative alpha-1,2-mannosidase